MMKLKQTIFLAISVFLFDILFAALPLADTTKVNQPKGLKNNIFNSVKSETSKTNIVPTFIPTNEPKTVVTMPQVADTTIIQPKLTPKDLVQNQPQANSSPKNTEEVISQVVPKIQHDQIANDNNLVHVSNHNVNKDIINKAVQEPLQESKQEPSVLYQDPLLAQDAATISFNFEDASLTNLLTYIESIFNIRFITDDIIVGAKDAKGTPVPVMSVAGHKINFRTNKNLTYKQAWDLFITFMHISGFNIIPMSSDRFFRVVPVVKSMTDAIPTYVGVDYNVLPDSEMIIRYVYFSKNISDVAKLQNLLKKFQSGSGKLDIYSDLKGLIFTDRSSSIKSLMRIVTEFDKGMTPEVVSVMKLKRANAADVINLYKTLNPQAAQAQGGIKIWNLPKEASLEYFPEINLVNDPRTNSLIIIGTAQDVKRVEDFITKYIDVELEKNTPPIFTYKLQYTNATDVSNLITQIVQYGSSTEAGKYGGLREGIKYFQKMNIVPDPHTNSLIINAMPEDFEAIKPLIEELDTPQKQVGIEVLIVQVKDVDVKTLGSQISGPNGAGSSVPGASPFGPTMAQSITAQTSGIPQGSPVVVTPGNPGQDDFSIKSSLGTLLGLPTVNEVGSILVTFGRPIWAVFKILKTITSTHIITNPFLVVANNTTATVSSGESRRQISSQIVASGGTQVSGLVAVDAMLNLNITPQINKGNIINLKIDLDHTIFTQPATLTQTIASQTTPRDSKKLSTKASIANGETLVLGGIMIESFSSASNGVPFLSSIPILGWFFKSKTRTVSRDHFMIFICPRLLDPLSNNKHVDAYSQYKLDQAQQHLDLIDESDWFADQKDPIQNAFFGNESSRLQQLYTSDMYEQRERLDGKIDNPKIKRRKKSRKSKYKKIKIDEEPPLIQPGTSTSIVNTDNKLKNSITKSIAQEDMV